MSIPVAPSESELISFADTSGVDAIIDASARLAADLRRHDESRIASPEALREAVHSVRAIQLVELLRNTEGDRRGAASMLFHVADLLSHSNVTVAWQALTGIPAAVVLLEHEELPVAWPLAESPDTWLALIPLRISEEAARMWLLDGCTLLGPTTLRASTPKTGMLGFPHGCIARVEREAMQRLPVLSLAVSTQECLLSMACALMTGLLNGALRRMVEEAYAYARGRKSAGKSIDLHQAVALRLADLALHQQGLALYLQAAVEQPEELGTLNVDHVSDSTARIARDAVQIAAAHGYVEGLPFKKLFEQSRTLACCIEMITHAATRLTPATN